MNPKKIAASAVALALGTSAIVAPQATALPETFVSPPGVLGNPSQDDCQVVMEDNVSTSRPGVAREATQSGVSAGVALNATNTEYLTWVTLDSKGERIFERAVARVDVANEASKGVTQSFTVKEQQPGALTFDSKLKGGQAVALNVTDIVPADSDKFSLAPRERQEVTAKLGLNQSLDKQTWAWKINQPTSSGATVTRVHSWATVNVAPWPFETDNCTPITASSAESRAIIADGNEYDTGITVANAANDYERLTGNVTVGGKAVADAQVRVDASGKVYVTLPKNATGDVDNNKPAKVNVQLLAQPREETRDSKFETYNSAQVLRVVDNLGRISQDSPEFTGSVPVQKFAPEYNSPSTVKPGKTVNVALKTQPGDVRGTAVDATYTVKNAPQGWTAEAAEDGTLKVTAPKDAKGGDTAEFTVEVAYPDGSVDTLKPKVTVKDFDSNLNQPGYGEAKDVPGATVTIMQTAKLPQGSTFTVVEGQPWSPQVNPTTGEIAVTIPKGATPGTVQDILVDVTYPDGSVDKRVPAKVTVLNTPGYGETTGTPGTEVKLPQTGKVAEGSTFRIDPSQDLGEWKPMIDTVTGEITVVIPENAREPKDIKVLVTDPNNGGKQQTVTAKVTPIPADPGETPGDKPGENPGDKPGENPGDKPGETPGDKPGETPGDKPGETPGDKPGTPVTPGSGNGIVVVVPGTPDAPGTGTTIEFNPTFNFNPDGSRKDPEGTVYELKPGWKVPDGWTVVVDKGTGKVTITPAASVTPGTVIEVPVQVTPPNGGKVEVRTIPVVVPGEGGITFPKDWNFNPQNPTVIVVPAPKDPQNPTGGEKITLPEGWTWKRDGDNIVITAPQNPVVDGGAGKITIPGQGGEVNITVTLDNGKVPADSPREQSGSSEQAKKCATTLFTDPTSPLLWLLPAAILLGVGAPLVGSMGPEVGKAIANVSAQMDIDLPNPWGGQGGAPRSENPVAATFNAEMARLNNQFGPQVAQAGLTVLALLSVAALSGLLAWYCLKDGDQKLSSGMWDDVRKNEEGSSSRQQ